MLNTYGIYILDVIVLIALVIGLKIAKPYFDVIVEEKDFEFIKKWVNIGVEAAEQVIQGSKLGETRKEWVIKLLNAVGIEVDETVDALIEATVKALNATKTALVEAANSAIAEISAELLKGTIGNDVINEIVSKIISALAVGNPVPITVDSSYSAILEGREL